MLVNETIGDLREVFNGLEPQEKELLLMSYAEDMSYKDIAARLGVTEDKIGALRTRKSRAIEKMSDRLNKNQFPFLEAMALFASLE